MPESRPPCRLVHKLLVLELGLELGFEFGSGFHKELMDWFKRWSGFLDISQFFAQIKSSHNLIVVILDLSRFLQVY